MKQIEEMFNKKTGIVEDNIMKNMDDQKTIILGEVYNEIVKSEIRIKEKYDIDIKKIEEDLESLTIKIGLGS